MKNFNRELENCMEEYKIRSITPKIRFNVFKRDGFKCQYCGRSAPEVVLHVDHIHPVCEGGDDNPLNLVSSCFDCNSGKGGMKLDDCSVITKQVSQMQDMNTQREQLEMLAEWRKGLLEVDKHKAQLIISELSLRFGKDIVEQQVISDVSMLVKNYPLQEIFDAIDKVFSNSVMDVAEAYVAITKYLTNEDSLNYIKVNRKFLSANTITNETTGQSVRVTTADKQLYSWFLDRFSQLKNQDKIFNEPLIIISEENAVTPRTIIEFVKKFSSIEVIIKGTGNSEGGQRNSNNYTVKDIFKDNTYKLK